MGLFSGRDQKVENLRKVDFLSVLSKNDLTQIARFTDEVTAPEGTTLIKEGESGVAFYIFITGAARIVRRGRTIATVGRGDFIGELALLDNEPSSASVVTTANSTLLAVPRRQFVSLIKTAPGLTQRLLVGLAKRLRETDKKLVG